MTDARKVATLKDVARQARVSESTASRVLNNEGKFSEETRRRVLQAARALEYRPKTSIQKTILALAVYPESDSGGLYTADLLRGITDQARKYEYKVNVVFDDPSKTVEEADDLVRDCEARRIDGCILLGTIVPRRREYSRFLHKYGVPAIGIGRCDYDEPVTVVGVDNIDAVACLTQYLIGQGHQRIAYAQGRANAMVNYDRLTGYRRVLDENNIPYDSRLVLVKIEQDGLSRLMSAPDHPTAFVAFDDIVAADLLQALALLGLQVPKDVSLVSADDKGVCAYLVPPVTAVKNDYYTIGRLAVRQLRKKLEKEDDREEVARIFTRSEIVYRASVQEVR